MAIIRENIKFKQRKELKNIDKGIETIAITLEDMKDHKNITSI